MTSHLRPHKLCRPPSRRWQSRCRRPCRESTASTEIYPALGLCLWRSRISLALDYIASVRISLGAVKPQMRKNAGICLSSARSLAAGVPSRLTPAAARRG